jgi:hypothetical protein
MISSKQVLAVALARAKKDLARRSEELYSVGQMCEL